MARRLPQPRGGGQLRFVVPAGCMKTPCEHDPDFRQLGRRLGIGAEAVDRRVELAEFKLAGQELHQGDPPPVGVGSGQAGRRRSFRHVEGLLRSAELRQYRRVRGQDFDVVRHNRHGIPKSFGGLIQAVEVHQQRGPQAMDVRRLGCGLKCGLKHGLRQRQRRHRRPEKAQNSDHCGRTPPGVADWAVRRDGIERASALRPRQAFERPGKSGLGVAGLRHSRRRHREMQAGRPAVPLLQLDRAEQERRLRMCRIGSENLAIGDRRLVQHTGFVQTERPVEFGRE